MSARPILLAGPTASGKSGLAVQLAEALGGVVVNADSQQVYAGWRILTARPTEAEEARVPHRLYGHVALDAAYSVGRWLRELAPFLEEASRSGLRPVITGGTGLYFKALTRGLAEIPPIEPGIRQRAEAELERLGLAGFAAALARRDPETAARIDLSNPARVLRAWEVLEQTGRPLSGWQAETSPPLVPLETAVPIALIPPRETLHARCDSRFDTMMADGALAEVERVMALGLPASAPGMKAVGAPELMAHLRGEIPLDQAVAAAKTATRRYAKRQLTWIRGQMQGWETIREGDLDTSLAIVRASDQGG